MDTDKYVYHKILTLTAALVALGTIAYHLIEKWSFVDAFYFCIVTLATVGYGDLVPKTDFGKLFTTVYIVIGIAILGAFINAFTKKRGVKMRAKAQAKHDDKHKQ
jgi:predicted membrane channel-forming protein YqfA (hemolysin III family)